MAALAEVNKRERTVWRTLALTVHTLVGDFAYRNRLSVLVKCVPSNNKTASPSVGNPLKNMPSGEDFFRETLSKHRPELSTFPDQSYLNRWWRWVMSERLLHEGAHRKPAQAEALFTSCCVRNIQYHYFELSILSAFKIGNLTTS